MLDPDIAQSLEENNVFVEYSMERFEHRISAQPVQPTRGSFNRFGTDPDPPASRRCSTKRVATNATSSYSSSSSAGPSSPDSSSGSDDDAAAPNSGNTHNLLHINNELVHRLDMLQDDNVALQHQVRQLRASQFDNIILATSVPPPPEAINNVDFPTASLKSGFPEYVQTSIRGLSDEVPDSKLFDPLSIALFNEDELPPKILPEIDSLRREVAELSEDKSALLTENHFLEKEKRALEVALAKARRDVDEAAITVVNKVSPSSGKLRTHALDSDVQRLCNLSRLLGDENERLRSQNRDTEAEVRILKEDLGESRAQNSRLMIEVSSAKAHKEVLEMEIERLKEAVAKAGREVESARVRVMEEVEGARRTIEGLREEEKRLINENVRLERELAAVLESLAEFEERQAVLRGEKQRAAADANRLEAELGDALARASNEGEARRKAAEKVDRAEATALELRQEAADIRFQMQQMVQELEREKAAHEATLQEMALLRLRERALTQDMRQLMRQPAGWSTEVAGPLMLLPASSSPRSVTSTPAALESQLSTWLSERTDLAEVDKELQHQVEKLARGFSESLQDMEDELFKWKDVTSKLEVALRQARHRSALCEKDAQGLLSHLLPSSYPSPASKNALHAAAASGAIAGFGLLAYTKLKRQSST